MDTPQIVIKRVGPVTSRKPAEGPTTTIPFRIEVETPEGTTLLTLSPDAARELAAELAIWLKARGFQ